MRILAFIFTLLTVSFWAVAQSAYTPKSGSPERQAICDGMREFVKHGYIQTPLPKPIVFKVEAMRVQGNYCYFQGLPIFNDGSDAIPKYLPDVVYNLCLKRGKTGWNVVFDLSRTDVPSDAEVREIKSRFPPDFPVSLLSEFWRGLLGKAR